MIEKPMSDIKPTDLVDLATRQVTERRTLDYKRDLDFRKDSDKKEFVADVLSFANAAGGDLIFGIDEARDANGGKLGYPEQPVGTKLFGADDDVKRAIEQCVRDSSEPRVPMVEVEIIHGFTNGPVVVVRVQRSNRAPHRSLRDNAFYARATTGRYQLDVGQLRALFVDASAQEEGIRLFVRRRVAAHVSGTPEQLASEGLPVSVYRRSSADARLVVHVVSSSFGDRGQAIDVRAFPSESMIASALPPSKDFRWAKRHNLEGVVVWQRLVGNSEKDPVTGYRQIFRQGAIECVDADCPNIFAEQNIVPGDVIEETVLENCRSSRDLLRASGCAFPLFVFVALANVHARRLSHRNSIPRSAAECAFDRPTIALPGAALMSPDADIERELQPTLDALWQAGGWAQSPSYSATGKRSP